MQEFMSFFYAYISEIIYLRNLNYITIGGVYEDFPLNSSIPSSIYLSLSSIGAFRYDGRENWMGNDSYLSYVVLAEGTTPEDTEPYVSRMLGENVGGEAMSVLHFNMHLHPLVGIHTSIPSVRNMLWILSLLAAVMLMSAALNYILIVIGQMGKRGREMAVRKCFGTSDARIFGRIMGESAFFLIVSLACAVFLIFCFSDTCRELLGRTPAELLSTGRVWLVEGVVCLILLAITGAVPAFMYCRTPVAAAFRADIKSRRAWKLALLSVQFFAAGLLACLLVIVGQQYAMLTDSDMGFEYENLGSVFVKGVPEEKRETLVSEISRLGCVEGVSSADHDFINGCSGNNVWLDDPLRTVNIADMYWANRNIFDVLGVKILQGETFRETVDTTGLQVVVEERFTDVFEALTGKRVNDMVGKSFNITEHQALDGSSEFIICGVMANQVRGGFAESADRRPGVMFFSPKIRENIYFRFTDMTPENMQAVQRILDDVCPGNELYVKSVKAYISSLTYSVRSFGTAVIIAGLAILLIAMIGLVGYTADEVLRRAREIAIRKVTGTPASKIVILFCRNVIAVALPTVILGGCAALVISQRWLSQFTDRITPSPLLLGLCIAVLLLLLSGTVVLNCLSVARSNPVDYLRSE